MAPVLLDTDILSAIMRRHPVATARAQVYLSEQVRSPSPSSHDTKSYVG